MRLILIASTIALAGQLAPPSRAQQPAEPAQDRLGYAVRLAPRAEQAAAPQAKGPSAIRVPELLDIPGGDVHRPVVEKIRALMNESCLSCHVAGLALDKDKPWGLSVVVADPTLRQQLKLGERGLVVTAVAPRSQAELAGIKEKDILLGSDGKPLTTVDGLKALVVEGETSLRGVRGEPVHVTRTTALKLLRDGEPVEVKLNPGAEVHPQSVDIIVTPPASTEFVVYRQALQGPGYWIGVSASPASETLLRHLKRAGKAGLVVDQVHKDSPAEKAGLKPNDLLLAIGDKPLTSLDDLVKAVNSAGDRAALSIRLLRGGETKAIEVRPDKKVAVNWAPPMDRSKQHGVANLEVLRMVQPGNWVTDILPYLDHSPTAWDAIVLPNAAGTPTRGTGAPAAAPAGVYFLPNAAGYPNVNPTRPAAPPGSNEALEARLKALEGQIGALTATIRELKEAVREKGKDR